MTETHINLIFMFSGMMIASIFFIGGMFFMFYYLQDEEEEQRKKFEIFIKKYVLKKDRKDET